MNSLTSARGTGSYMSKLAGQPVIVGAGLAGLACALSLSPMPVVVITKAALGTGCSSVWAQGGIAAALGEDDSVALHIADTIAAGAGLCDDEAVARIVSAAPRVIAALESWGVRFDRKPDGTRAVSLEAAHSRRRVLHAGGGDTAGLNIMQALIALVRATPSIQVLEQTEVVRLITRGGAVHGLVVQVDGMPMVLPTRRVVIATGGIGGLWPHSTNPSGATGQGLALAALAGTNLLDIEFVQFHPTALDIGRDPMPLASEALRGEGARLVDDAGNPVMSNDPRGDLAPRDVVARAVAQRYEQGGRVFLDGRATIGAAYPKRFPTLYNVCADAGIDLLTTPIPVRPAAHYHMGGIAVESTGRSTIDGLWACGEAAATGLHGANRLASNSLLEAVVTGMAVAEDIAGATPLDRQPALVSMTLGDLRADNPAVTETIRQIMGRHLGIARHGDGIAAALTDLRGYAASGHKGAIAALLVAAGAYLRLESRGSHYRLDYPDALCAPVRQPVTLSDALELAGSLAGSGRAVAGKRP